MPVLLRALLGALLLACCMASPAGAQEEGVFVDPDTPGGKEYAIPLESERRQADPAGPAASETSGVAPLFGAGIVDASDDAPRAGAEQDPSPSSGDGEGGGSGAKQDETPAGAAASADERAALSAATSTPGAPSGGLGTQAIIGVSAAGLLLIGGLAGWTIRRARG